MPKTYHTRIANSTFIFQPVDKDDKPLAGQTEVLQFHGNTLVVDEEKHIKAIDLIADKPGSMIYTQDVKAVLSQADTAPFEQVKARAAEVVEQIAKAGQRV